MELPAADLSQNKKDVIHAPQFFGAVEQYSSYPYSHSGPSFKNVLKHRPDFYSNIDLSSNNEQKLEYRPLQVCHHIIFEGIQLGICTV